MSSDESSTLRLELEDAIGKVRRQIELEDVSTGAGSVGPSQKSRLLDELAAELSQLEEAFGSLPDGDEVET